MSKPFMVLLFISVIMASMSIVVLIKLFDTLDENARNKSCYLVAKDINDKNNITQNKISMIERTLLVCYGISKWEARYYAIYFNDFSNHYKNSVGDIPGHHPNGIWVQDNAGLPEKSKGVDADQGRLREGNRNDDGNQLCR